MGYIDSEACGYIYPREENIIPRHNGFASLPRNLYHFVCFSRCSFFFRFPPPRNPSSLSRTHVRIKLGWYLSPPNTAERGRWGGGGTPKRNIRQFLNSFLNAFKRAQSTSRNFLESTEREREPFWLGHAERGFRLPEVGPPPYILPFGYIFRGLYSRNSGGTGVRYCHLNAVRTRVGIA